MIDEVAVTVVTRPTSTSNLVLTGNRLVDVQWKFGVSAASSENSSIGTTFLQLKLVIRKAAIDGTPTENVYMELTLPQFYSFLHEMERAKASMDHIK